MYLSPQNYIQEVKGNADKLKVSISSYRRNWALMSECTAENVLKSKSVSQPDQCLERLRDQVSYSGVLNPVHLERLFYLRNGQSHHNLADNLDRAANYLAGSFVIGDIENILVPQKLRGDMERLRAWLDGNDDFVSQELARGLNVTIGATQCAQELAQCTWGCNKDLPGNVLQCVEGYRLDCISRMNSAIPSWDPFKGVKQNANTIWCNSNAPTLLTRY